MDFFLRISSNYIVRSMVWGFILGTAWAVTRIGNMLRKGPLWKYRWFQSLLPKDDRRGLRRISRAVHSRTLSAKHLLLGPLIVQFSILALLFVSESDLLEAAIAGLVSFLLVSVVALGLGRLSDHEDQVVGYAALEIARRLPRETANALLLPMAEHSIPGHRKVSIPALKALGSPEAFIALLKLGHDPFVTVSEPAQKATEEILRLSQVTSSVLSTLEMGALSSLHADLVPKMRSLQPKKENWVLKEKMDACEQRLDAIVFSQLHLRRAFPYVFCLQCGVNAERWVYEGWEWVRCKRCRDALDLLAGVKHVTGQIGGQGRWSLSGDKLRIELWDEEKRKGRGADIAALEIIGGKDLHYDWAVSAVVEALVNGGHKDGRMIEVQIVSEPVLEMNSIQLLKTLSQ